MKNKTSVLKILAGSGLAIMTVGVLSAAPFYLPVTYQGRLDAASLPANGSFELQVGLFNFASGGSAQQLLTNNIAVSNGLFTTVLQLDGSELENATTDWLELGVRTNGSAGAFTILTPRQELTHAPLAARALKADVASSLPQDAVASYEIVDGSIGAVDIEDGQVVKSVNTLKDAVTLAAGGGISISSAGNTLTISDTNSWKLNGNTGANPTNGAFLGTTDNLPLDFKVNGQRVFRLADATDLTYGNSPNLVGGFAGNIVSNGFVGCVIGGGGSGGNANRAGNHYATVVGGRNNTASGFNATAMGSGSVASGPVATAIGLQATASGTWATAAGYSCVAGGSATTAMGYFNTASGDYATAFGRNTLASGTDSTAMGRNAKANHIGSLVWADATGTDFASTTDNQFRVRATGGMDIVGGNTVEAFKYSGSRSGGFANPIGYAENNNTSGSSAPVLRLVGKGGNSVDGVLSVSASGTGDLAVFGNASAFVSRLSTNGTWSALAFNPTSDRNAKENFTAMNPQQVLAKVAALPIARWNYKAAPGVEHVGPVAQDFHAAFGLNGADDKHIATVDADGVALAAIQGLNQKLETENAVLKARLDRLEQLLERQMAAKAMGRN